MKKEDLVLYQAAPRTPLLPKRPMLASDLEEKHARFPLLCSPKLDGIRALVCNGVVYSRSLKELPNTLVQFLYGREEMEGFDGELIVGAANEPGVWNRTQSGVMSEEGEPDVMFYVFDLWNEDDKPYVERLQLLTERVAAYGSWCASEGCSSFVTVVPQTGASNISTLRAFETEVVAAGFEGLIARDPQALYKHGRATARSNGLLKVKSFCDAEAEVVAVVEREHNANEATLNELGLTKRSSHQAGKVKCGDLGAFVCRFPGQTATFSIGTGQGLTLELRAKLWAERDSLPGRLVKFRYFKTGSEADALPRHPVFLGFRDERDT